MRPLLVLLAASCATATSSPLPPPGQLPWLTLSPFTPGADLTITVEGADPGETVYLLLGDEEAVDGGPCPDALAGGCVDIRGNARLFLQATADADGVLSTTLGPIPDAPGFQACFQPVLLRGPASREGNVVCGTVGDDADGDGIPDATDLCDGDDALDLDGDGVPDACDDLVVRAGGLVLHLDARAGLTLDGDRVTAWADQSGSGTVVAQPLVDEQPTLDPTGIDGQPALVFDGNDHLLAGPVFPTGDYSKVVTFALDAVASNNLLSSASSGHALYYASGTAARHWHGGAFIIADRDTPLDTLTTLAVTWDADTQTGRLYQDGVFLGSGTGAIPNDFTINVGGHGEGNHLQGRISEIHAYDRVLSPEEVAAHQDHVDARYRGGRSGGVDFLQPTSWHAARDLGPGAVARWPDRSGNGLDLTQSVADRLPTRVATGLNGSPTLYFDGDRLFRSDGFPTGSYTKAAVFRAEALGGSHNVFSSDGPGHALYYFGDDALRTWHAGRPVLSDTPTMPGRPVVALTTWDASTGEAVLYQDGLEVGRGELPPNTSDDLSVGGHGNGFYFRGQIAEVLTFAEVLDAGERDAVQRTLQRSYGLYTAPDTVVVEAEPQRMQVFQRDDADTCLVGFEGVASGGSSSEVRVRALQDGLPFGETVEPLVRLAGEARFDVGTPLDAGLHDYTVVLETRASDGWTEHARVEQVACGDLLLVAGQSNAEARLYYNETAEMRAYESPFARSFGSAATSASALLDTSWNLATSQRTRDRGTVGQWGLMLAADILATEGVAVGVINGAQGGTTIAQNSRDDSDPDNGNTIYGRMLARAQAAGFDVGARALFWYQGESDGSQTEAYYADAFAELHDDWRTDYPGLEHLYVVQIRSGCGGSTFVREAMRKLPLAHPDVQVMSTTGLDGHDGCHYAHIGYRQLADRLFGLLAKDRYGLPDDPSQHAPDLVSATVVGTQIELVFDPPGSQLSWDPGSETDFRLSDGVAVTSGSASGNTVTLQLAGPTAATTLDYVGHTGDGPWVTNSAGIGILTFFGVPLQ